MEMIDVRSFRGSASFVLGINLGLVLWIRVSVFRAHRPNWDFPILGIHFYFGIR